MPFLDKSEAPTPTQWLSNQRGFINPRGQAGEGRLAMQVGLMDVAKNISEAHSRAEAQKALAEQRMFDNDLRLKALARQDKKDAITEEDRKWNRSRAEKQDADAAEKMARGKREREATIALRRAVSEADNIPENMSEKEREEYYTGLANRISDFEAHAPIEAVSSAYQLLRNSWLGQDVASTRGRRKAETERQTALEATVSAKVTEAAVRRSTYGTEFEKVAKQVEAAGGETDANPELVKRRDSLKTEVVKASVELNALMNNPQTRDIANRTIGTITTRLAEEKAAALRAAEEKAAALRAAEERAAVEKAYPASGAPEWFKVPTSVSGLLGQINGQDPPATPAMALRGMPVEQGRAYIHSLPLSVGEKAVLMRELERANGG